MFSNRFYLKCGCIRTTGKPYDITQWYTVFLEKGDFHPLYS